MRVYRCPLCGRTLKRTKAETRYHGRFAWLTFVSDCTTAGRDRPVRVWRVWSSTFRGQIDPTR